MTRKVDEELRVVLDRRGKAADRLMQALIEIDMLTNRVDVLLDRRCRISAGVT